MALSDKGCFKINNTEFKAKSITPSWESLASSESGRSDDGVMHINFVRSNVRKWEIEMPPCYSSDVNALLSLVQGKIYNITIWDASANAEQTVQVYTSNSKADCYSGVLHNGLYVGLSFSAIEM